MFLFEYKMEIKDGLKCFVFSRPSTEAVKVSGSAFCRDCSTCSVSLSNDAISWTVASSPCKVSLSDSARAYT